MATTEETPPKRRRYSRDPDFQVVVEGETILVHSHDLMRASDVFASMLESDMREVDEGQIVLPGKSKVEFRTLMQHISITHGAAPPDITEDTVEFLLKWADEYQMVGLTSRCEKFLERQTGQKTVEGLRLAVEYKLEHLQEKFSKHIAAHIFEYRFAASQFVDYPAIMNVLLPALFKAACLDTPPEKPTEQLKVQDVWPLVTRALEATQHGFTKFDTLNWLTGRFRELMKIVFDRIPTAINPQNGGDAADLKSVLKLQGFDTEAVGKVLELLVAARSISRSSTTGKYTKRLNANLPAWCL